MSDNTILNILDVLYVLWDENDIIISSNNIDKINELKTKKISNGYINDGENCYEYEKKKYNYKGESFTLETYKNVTKSKNDTDKLDFTTQLLNKTYTFKEINKYIEQSNNNLQPFTVVMADIDFFKKINDTYGHIAGDEVLKKIGELLVHNTREYDIVGRFGGEEFIFILKDIDLETTKKRLENIRDEISKLELKYNDLTINNITMSFGAYYYNNILENVFFTQEDINKIRDEIIEKADQALYYSKSNGRNQIHFYSDSASREKKL